MFDGLHDCVVLLKSCKKHTYIPIYLCLEGSGLRSSQLRC